MCSTFAPVCDNRAGCQMAEKVQEKEIVCRGIERLPGKHGIHIFNRLQKLHMKLDYFGMNLE